MGGWRGAAKGGTRTDGLNGPPALLPTPWCAPAPGTLRGDHVPLWVPQASTAQPRSTLGLAPCLQVMGGIRGKSWRFLAQNPRGEGIASHPPEPLRKGGFSTWGILFGALGWQHLPTPRRHGSCTRSLSHARSLQAAQRQAGAQAKGEDTLFQE